MAERGKPDGGTPETGARPGGATRAPPGRAGVTNGDRVSGRRRSWQAGAAPAAADVDHADADHRQQAKADVKPGALGKRASRGGRGPARGRADDEVAAAGQGGKQREVEGVDGQAAVGVGDLLVEDERAEQRDRY